ncbi:hypothetical protein HPP92_006491 [Vanilla planifolia]|uniref:SANT domain-containing protein n=1 Tax=Vanilla planifolia TaxID=51239 RepID=A0A835RFQ6_VANPL|nr:hypothetical protein HPP92_006491 [Vanilla planifolia]
MVFVGSMSPATPTSVTCSSSPGTEEKLSMKTSNLDADRAKDSSRLGLNGSPGNFSIKVGEIDADSVCTLASALNDLMQYEDACSGDSSFARFSTINKLLLLKNEISKELEKTEYEIDLFENELMSLASVEQRNYREHPLKSKSNVGGSSVESFDEPKTSFELPSNNSVLASSVFLEEEKAVQRAVSGECDAEVKVVNHDLTEAFSSGVAQFSCLDRQNDNRNVLFDLCSEVNGKGIVPHFIDVEPLTPFTTVTPAVHLSCGLVGNSAAEKKSNSLLASVMNSNSNATKRVSEEFVRAMCSMSSQVDIWESDKLLQCRKNYMLIKDKLAVEKRLLKFKERVLAHKFRVLHHLWREDLRLLAVLKHRPKSSKRLEVNIRSSQTALQRHRSSTRSRFLLPAGNLSLVPTTEILNFTSKILSCSQIRHYRNYLKMPAQIIDEKDKTRLRFNTKNGLIEYACSIEKERVAINPWTPEEKELFVNMLATFGKDFRKISSFISHKTTADCIEFYYKNHKAENFKEVMRQLKHRNQWQRLHSNKYLITTGAKWNHEANAASLDFLGVASTPDSRSNNFTRIIPRHKGRSDYHENKILHGVNASLEKANSVEISGTDREAVAADVLVGICGSSEAMSSCATNYIDPRENVLLDRPLTPK